jgi:hypothetical protein
MAEATQYLVVGLIVLAAFVFVGRRVWSLLVGKGSGRCGRCSSCSLTTVTMIPLESLHKLPSDDDQR